MSRRRSVSGRWVGGSMFESLRDLDEQRHIRRLRTGDTPEKVAEDARRERRGPPARYRSSAEPALKAALAMWLYRGPLR